MATKQDIITYIRRNYQSRELENGALALVFSLPEGRDHQVFVDWNNDEGTWTEVKGIVCAWSPEMAVRAVEENDQIFGIHRFLDWVVVSHPQLTATADEEEIDRALTGVAYAADSLERKLTGGNEF